MTTKNLTNYSQNLSQCKGVAYVARHNTGGCHLVWLVLLANINTDVTCR